MSRSRGDTQPQEPAGTQGDAAAIQDLAAGAASLDGERGSPIKMHELCVCFCRNQKRHDPSAGNGQSSLRSLFFFISGKLWGYNGSYAAHSALLFEDDEPHSHRNAVWRQRSLRSASKSSFGQHTFNKTRTFWKKSWWREAGTTPSLENIIWEGSGMVQPEENPAEGGGQGRHRHQRL